MSTFRPAFRYTLMAFSTALAIAIFLLDLLLASNFLILIFSCISLLGVLIYIPAALILSLKASKSSFTIVRAEVAYLAFQNLILLINTILSILVAAATRCHPWEVIPVFNGAGGYTYTGVYRDNSQLCASRGASAGLCALSLVITLIWMGWLIHITRMTGSGGIARPGHVGSNNGGPASSMTVRQAFKVPAGLLVKGRLDEYENYYAGQGGGFQNQQHGFPQSQVGYQNIGHQAPPLTLVNPALHNGAQNFKTPGHSGQVAV